MVTTGVLRSLAALELLSQTLDNLTKSPGTTNIPTFLAIDTELSKERLSELGISTFDPLCLLTPTDRDPDSLGTRIVTCCYAKGGSKDRHRYKLYRFGTSQRFQNHEVPQILDTHFEVQQKIILIGHGINGDLCFLKNHFGIDLSQKPTVEAIVDTSGIARSVLKTKNRLSLKKTLQSLKLDYIGLHNAAHDSRYTLRVLLMLLARHKKRSNGDDDRFHRKEEATNFVPLMEEIARFHKIQEGRKRCASTRVKVAAPPDMFQEDGEEHEDEDSGIMNLLA